MNTALDACATLLGFAVLFQTLELLLLRPAWSGSGIWRWENVRTTYADWPRPMRSALDLLLGERVYLCLLAMTFLASLSLAVSVLSPDPDRPNAIAPAVIFLGTWLTALRWGGRFNGGSDSMTAIVAAGVAIARAIGTPSAARACLGYIAVQLTASYFIAGIGKLKSADWRAGVALKKFIEIPGYDHPPPWFRNALERPTFAGLASAAVLIFECTFPFAWIGPRTCSVYLTAAFVFHLLNWWVFGLNRFLFAWLAAYPALLFWCVR